MSKLELGNLPERNCIFCGKTATHFIKYKTLLTSSYRMYCLKDWLVEVRTNGWDRIRNMKDKRGGKR